MGEIWNGFVEALRMILRGDPYVMKITLFTLYVCGVATLIGMITGIPLGSWLAFADFPGRRLLVVLVNTGMGLPPVVVGLFVYIFLRRNGPLGFLGWLYTPKGIILAEAVLAMPLIAGIVLAAMQATDAKMRWQILSLGASRRGMYATLLAENRVSLLTAVMAGFGAVISEVGAAMMVGGNLMLNGEPYTRTLTTATVSATNMGEQELAIALGIILLAITLVLISVMTWLQQREARGNVPGLRRLRSAMIPRSPR
jgi:tungstate transport system permease protein